MRFRRTCSGPPVQPRACGTSRVCLASRLGVPADVGYHLALANKRAGETSFLVSGDDGSVPRHWRVSAAFDSTPRPHPWRQVDLVTILLHELAHGLGFSSFMNPGTGGGNPSATCLSSTDIYLQFAHDNITSTQFSAMTTNAQRAAAVLQVENVVWTGAHVTTGMASQRR